MLMRLGSLIFAVPAVLLIVLYGIELSTVTSCIEAGGHYNFTSGECGEEISERISFYQRHRPLVDLTLLLSTAGALMMTWAMLKKGMTPKSD